MPSQSCGINEKSINVFVLSINHVLKVKANIPNKVANGLNYINQNTPIKMLQNMF